MTMLLSVAALGLISPPASAMTEVAQASRVVGCNAIETPQGLMVVDRLPYVAFESGSADITPHAAATLDAFVAEYDAPSECQMVIEGHADRVGSASRNLRLSERRANAVAAYLRRRRVTAPFVIRFHGETQLLVETPDEVAEPQNRYVGIWINDPRLPLP